MNLAYNIAQVMHKIRVKLYTNYLPGQENTFIARTDSEAVLNIEQVCAALRDRGGFTGNIEDVIDHVKKYNNEMAYQLCDGFAVSNGYFAIYPNLGSIRKGVSHHIYGGTEDTKGSVSLRITALCRCASVREFTS